MNVRIVEGKRVIDANGRDRKVMREASGLFAFVWDNVKVLDSDGKSAFTLEDVENAKGLLEATIASACAEGEDVAKAAGETT